MKYQIIDNFLEKDDFEKLKNTMLDHYFPWHYNSMKTDDSLSIYNFQFTHLFYSDFKPNSNFFPMLSGLIEKLSPASILRIKANLTPVTSEIVTYDYHLDFSNVKCKTAVFYINTNNGATLFEDGTIVNSAENRLVCFDSNIPHTGTSCTDQKVRCVINLNYFEIETL